MNNKDAGRPSLADEMNEMTVEEIQGRRKQEKPREKPIQTPNRPSRNPHGIRHALRIPERNGWRATSRFQ